MKRLLITLLAALALPTALNAEEFTEIKPKNIYSYKKSSLVKWESDGRRFINFIGTTKFQNCFTDADQGCRPLFTKRWFKQHGNKSIQNLIFNYELDCVDQKFNRNGDHLPWSGLFIDQTAVGVYQKYCPLEEWSKLPNK